MSSQILAPQYHEKPSPTSTGAERQVLQQLRAEMPTVKLAVDYVKFLSLVAIERAQSGHPGLPLGCAALGVVLYRYLLNFVGEAPTWSQRDRFILSAGHGSMLLYALNYLFGYKFTVKDLKEFRAMHSCTPGHPELRVQHGIETTTGPLGQGFANAVGLALEAKLFNERLRSELEPVLKDKSTSSRQALSLLVRLPRIVTLMGDGCMMEGVTQEAASLAGHLGLENLLAVYDANNASIDGQATLALSEDIVQRFQALNWHVKTIDIRNQHNSEEKLLQTLGELFDATLPAAQAAPSSQSSHRAKKPTLIIMTTHIGAGVKRWENDPGIHGRPAGREAIAEFLYQSPLYPLLCAGQALSKEQAAAYVDKILAQENFPTREEVLPAPFYANERGHQCKRLWEQSWELYSQLAPPQHKILCQTHYTQSFTPAQRQEIWNTLGKVACPIKKLATRDMAGNLLNALAAVFPQLIGGSADLVASTKATIKASSYITANDFTGRNVAFGVREHGMGAIGNGLALGGRFIPFTSTFLVFSDYMRPTLRLAAMMGLKHLFIFSHDSFYVGEDGPTHQPIEHLNALRLIPKLPIIRPASFTELAYAFMLFLTGTGPLVMITSRQSLTWELSTMTAPAQAAAMPSSPLLLAEKMNEEDYAAFIRGAYIYEEAKDPNAITGILLGSGSELGTLLLVKQRLEREGPYSLRLISLPILNAVMNATSGEDDNKQLWQKLLAGTTKPPPPVYVLEASTLSGMRPFLNSNWYFRTCTDFGISGPAHELEKHFHFNEESVYTDVKAYFS